MSSNATYRRALRRIAALSTLSGESRFKVAAYDRAARAIEGLEESLHERALAGTVQELDGFGASLARVIEDIAEHGRSPYADELEAALPAGVVDLLAVRGLGASKARKLWKDHGIESLDALEAAATSGTLASFKGFGAKTQTAILTELQRLKRVRGKVPYAQAWQIAADAASAASGTLARVALAGGALRADTLLDAVTLLVFGDHEQRGAAASAIRESGVGGDLSIRIEGAPLAQAGLARVLASSSEGHRDALAQRASAAGLSFDDPAGWGDAAATEVGVYEALGLPLLPAPLRADARSVSAAIEGWLPQILTMDHLRSDLHMHTRWSDGAVAIAEMAEAAAARGLEFIAVTDHSQALTVANGLDRDRVLAQIDEVVAVNASTAAGEGARRCRVLTGLEVDILDDGSLDMDDDVLDRLDWVVGSVHRNFGMSESAMTDRLLRAIRSGRISAIGHPTGRKIGTRDGYGFDLDAILDACEIHNVALELNASPHRLDLDAELLGRVLERDVWITVNTDAHSPRELANAAHGVAMAQRAWVPRDRVLNTLSLDGFRAEVSRRVNAV